MRTVGEVTLLDTVEEILMPGHTALLVVDVQNDGCLPSGWFAQQGRDVSHIMAVVPRIQMLVDSARAAGVLVVLIEQTTLPNGRSDSPAWLRFKTRDGRTRTDYTLDGSWGQQTLRELGPATGDLLVRKNRPSAFHRTNLDLLLRANAIQSVAVCGTITQGCVQATVMDASFHDYYVVVVEDAVQSYSQDLHENALTFMRSRYDMARTDDVARLWAQARSKGSA